MLKFDLPGKSSKLIYNNLHVSKKDLNSLLAQFCLVAEILYARGQFDPRNLNLQKIVLIEIVYLVYISGKHYNITVSQADLFKCFVRLYDKLFSQKWTE